MAIKGVVYLNQKVAAEDHAALFQMLISDGIISGCGVSSRLNVLTISEGMFIVAGRLTRILGSESITIPTTQSGGYARIKGVCDMGGAATRSTFGQFRFEVEYNVAIDGFNPLRRENINYGGQIYEVEWAILTLGESGNITNVDVKIGQSHGGGSGNVTEADFSNYGTADVDYKFVSSGNDWEVAFLNSATLHLEKALNNVDIFLISAGGNGSDGEFNNDDPYGGKAGNGGDYLRVLGVSIPSGEYAINIGSRASGQSSITAFGSMFSSDSESAIAGLVGSSIEGTNGVDGPTAWTNNISSLTFPGRKYGSSAGAGGSQIEGGRIIRGGHGGENAGDGYHNDDHPGGDGTANTGSGGGGGGAYYNRGAPSLSGTSVGGKGGSGIILITNHREAQSA